MTAQDTTGGSDGSGLAQVLGSLVDHVAETVVVLDEAGTVVFVNRGAERMLGHAAGDWIGRSALEIVHPDDLAVAYELLVSSQATGPGVKEPVVHRIATADGGWMPMEVITSNVALDSGELVLVVSARPAGARRPQADILDEAGLRLAHMFEHAAIGMTQTGLDGRILRANRQFAEMVEEDAEALVGRPFVELVDDADAARVGDALGAIATGRLESSRDDCRFDVGGRTIHANLTGSLVRDRFGEPMYVATQVIDLTELRSLQAELEHRSTHDPLTGLANRALVGTLLDQALARADRDGTQVAVLFVDLDDFKAVNDRHGHHAGDAVLIATAERLVGAVRAGDLVARIGGDEFLIVCEHSSTDQASELAARILEQLAAPVVLGDGASARVGASIGLAVSGGEVRGGAELVRRADVALYAAKRAGGGRLAMDEAGAL